MSDDAKSAGQWQRFNARLPQWLYDALKEAAFDNRRPMNDELVYRLVRSLRPDILEGEEEAIIAEGPASPAVSQRAKKSEQGPKGDIETRLERVEYQLDAMVKWLLRQRGLEQDDAKALRNVAGHTTNPKPGDAT